MIRNIILDSLLEVSKVFHSDKFDNVNDQTLIFENLDSMAVLDLIIEIENKLQESFGKFIQIADETIMDEVKTPFKTLASLIDFIETKLKLQNINLQ
jgi:acyl carrier protein